MGGVDCRRWRRGWREVERELAGRGVGEREGGKRGVVEVGSVCRDIAVSCAQLLTCAAVPVVPPNEKMYSKLAVQNTKILHRKMSTKAGLPV